CPPILFNNTAYTEIYPLSLHDALPILAEKATFEETAYLLIYGDLPNAAQLKAYKNKLKKLRGLPIIAKRVLEQLPASAHPMDVLDRKSTRLNSSHVKISYAVFCLKKKK